MNALERNGTPSTGLSGFRYFVLNLIVALLSGPVFVFLMTANDLIECVRNHGGGASNFGDCGIDVPMLVVGPMVTFPFIAIPALFLALPASLVVSGFLLAFGKAMKGVNHVAVWVAIGGALGFALGPMAFGVLGPMDSESRTLAHLLGVVDGVFCSALLHRTLRKRGAFRR